MNQLVIGLAQINPTVGALEHNTDLILDRARQAHAAGAQVVVFPELAVSGYPPEDLVLKPHFIEDVARQLQRLTSALPPELIVIAGAPVQHELAIYNAAVVLQDGRIQSTYFKMRLPNYGVFDEKRVFAEGQTPLILEIGAARLAIHICEDSWSTNFNSCTLLENAGLDGIINLSASPYHRGKASSRRDTLARTAAALNATLLYCNLTGGQDELVFDGRSLVLTPDGQVPASAAIFKDDLLIYPLTLRERPAIKSSKAWNLCPLKLPKLGTFSGSAGASPSQTSHTREGEAPAEPLVYATSHDLAEVYHALSLGLADYVNKNGFGRVVIAISGGIDSALVAAIAVDALGKDRVIGVTMPSRFSSDDTYNDAREMAQRLGIEFYDVPIKRLHDLYLEELVGHWPGRNTDTTEENLQARIRGNIVMALSNKFGWLVVTTGNKSEMATGYCTLYGDMAGGFALIKDVPKTLVFELCRWRNANTPDAPPVPETIIDRPPSAELRANQKDQDSLPPYEILDALIERYVEKDWSAERMVADGFDPDTVARVIHLIDGNEYKRRQGPPGIKITPKAFGRDRRLPITNLYHERVKTRRK